MSFCTSLKFYRPGRPVRISTLDVAAFVSDLYASEIVEPALHAPVNLEFRREKGVDSDPVIANLDTSASTTVVRCLQARDREIIRGFFGIGALRDDVADSISRIGSPDNSVDFTPYSLSFEIGPVEMFSLATDKSAKVGSMAMCVTGDGYLWPWTFPETVQKVAASRQIAELTELCRSHWPLPARPARWLSTRRRKSLGDLWPYEDLDRPLDWCWGLHET